MSKKQMICKRCIMDTTVPDIVFYEDGTCSVCREFEAKVQKDVKTPAMWDKIVGAAIIHGNGKEYDCVVGVSGGLDSTYLTYMLWRTKVSALLVHIDGGWDSELSKENIEKMRKIVHFDYVIVPLPMDEFTDIVKSAMKADVVDIEASFDHAIPAILYEVAEAYNIKYIFTASNTLTEGFMPQSWRFDKQDAANIRDIHKKHGTIPINEFPFLNPWKSLLWYRLIKGIHIYHPLNWVDYKRENALKAVQEAFDWKDYGGKNYEFLFTRFDKAYMQPMKFGIDKRKALYSGQIMTGVLTRDEALAKMNEAPISVAEYEELRKLFLTNMQMTDVEFDDYILRPVKSHLDYKHGVWIHRFTRFLKWVKRRL